MESDNRNPLSPKVANGTAIKTSQHSKLPMPGLRSRLAQPGTISRMPMPKRKASPENVPAQPPQNKRPRIGNTSFENSYKSRSTSVSTKTGSQGGMRKRSVSASSLSNSKPAVSKRPVATATRRVPESKSGRGVTAVRAGVTNKATSKPPAGKTMPSKPAAPAQGGTKKRAAWDLKGRLLDMEQVMGTHLSQNSELQYQISTNNDRIHLLENLNTQLKGTVQQKESETTEASNLNSELKRKLSNAEQELTSCKKRWEEEMEDLKRKTHTQISDLEFSKSTLERHKTSLEDELASKQQEIAGLKMTVSQMTSAQEGIKAELEATKVTLTASEADARQKAEKIERLDKIIAEQQSCIKSMEDRLRDHEMTRRQLHNTIQELKGNIRVFCRVRPLLGDEKLGIDEIQHITFNEEDPRMMELEKLAEVSPNESVASQLKKSASGKFEFHFDRVFQPTNSQEDVFDEISQLVQSALDGYHVCIFAYGQTGSGKTYTMEGPEQWSEENMGMIPRAVTQIFDSVKLLEDKGWMYEFTSSFLEIYNETIRDLLGDAKEEVKHEIKFVAAKSNEVHVTNLTTVPVTSADKVQHLLQQASSNRAVAATNCNERSSRSHSVFQLKIAGKNEITSDTCSGVLNLIDLAGSERLKESGSQGARLKETQCINKSLSNLGNVIMALANKDPHVPYRNSKLTHLLSNSLGGNSKCLMFVNVSPKEECFGETLSSLRFATKVNNCNIGTATQRKK